MEKLDLTNQTEIVTDLKTNYITRTIKASISTLKSKIKPFIKTTSKSSRLKAYNYKGFTQHQDSKTMTAESPNLNDDNQKCSKLDECLKKMPPIQRKAFTLRTLENKSTAFICNELNISEALFWKLIHQARKELVLALNTQLALNLPNINNIKSKYYAIIQLSSTYLYLYDFS